MSISCKILLILHWMLGRREKEQPKRSHMGYVAMCAYVLATPDNSTAGRIGRLNRASWHVHQMAKNEILIRVAMILKRTCHAILLIV